MTIYDLKNSKLGMTLIEMVISLVVLSILMTSTMGIIISSNNVFVSTSKASIDKQVGNSIFELFKGMIQYSTTLKLADQGKNLSMADQQVIKLENGKKSDGTSTSEFGRITYKSKVGTTTTSLYDDSFYAGRYVKYRLSKASDSHVKLEVFVYRNDKVCYHREGTFKCVNMSVLASRNINVDNVENITGYNQEIYFICNEGFDHNDQAWEIQHKIEKFYQGYNAILNEYTAALQEYQSDLKTWKSNVDSKGKITKAVRKDLIEDAVSARNTAFFGASDLTSVTDASNFNSTKDTITTNADGDVTAVTGCNLKGNNAEGETVEASNLRKYYQAVMYNYLKFSPTATVHSTKLIDAYKYSEDSVKPTITSKTSNGTTVSYPNPYYGVAATKEQLFFAFLLNYYDKSEPYGVITTSEMPYFDDPVSLFDGSIFYNEANAVNYADDMVMLCLFFESSETGNIDNSSKPLATVDCVNYPYYVRGDSVTSNWIVPVGGFSISGESTAEDIAVSSTGNATLTVNAKVSPINQTDSTFFSTTNTYNSLDFDNAVLHKNSKYWFDYTDYSASKSGNVVTLSSLASDTGWIKGFNGEEGNYTGALNLFLNDKNATDTTKAYAAKINSYDSVANEFISGYTNAKSITEYADLTSTTDSTFSSGGNSFNLKKLTFTVKSDKNLQQGWYYYKEVSSSTRGSLLGNSGINNDAKYQNYNPTGYYFFYIKNSDTIEYAAADKQFAVHSNEQVQLYRDNLFNLYFTRYQQSQFAGEGSDSLTYAAVENRNISDVPYYNLYNHNFGDYIIYGVDWGTWSGNPSSGILNNLISNGAQFIGELLNSGLKYKLDEITADYADKSLGNSTNLTLNSLSLSRSYDSAWMVYNQNNGTWYYLPSSTNRATAWYGSTGLGSLGSTPMALKITKWGSSANMISDIGSRQVNADVVFGTIIDNDALWVGLPSTPVTNSISSGSLRDLTISGATMNTGYDENTRAYTASLTVGQDDTSASIGVTATSTSTDAILELFVDGKLIKTFDSGVMSSEPVTINVPLDSNASDYKDKYNYERKYLPLRDEYKNTDRTYNPKETVVVVKVTNSNMITQKYTINVFASKNAKTFEDPALVGTTKD